MSGPRKATPRGQMSRGSATGPAVMLMPPHIRATFVPNPPLKSIPPIRNRRKHPVTGTFEYLKEFEKGAPPERTVKPTPKAMKEAKSKRRQEEHQEKIKPLIEEYRKEQQEFGGEYKGMNCYNTLFVGRLAYEVNERKLLREMESFGPVKDIKLVTDKEGKSKGYAFVEYENEEDMKRAYRGADGMKIEGRHIVVDVERGHTVPTWLPRRLGGGFGGTRYVSIIRVHNHPVRYFNTSVFCRSHLFLLYRLGGKDQNVTFPGRFDPSRPDANRPPPPMMMDGPPPPGMGRGRGPPPPMGYDGPGPGGYGGGYRDGPGGYGGPPPPGGGRYGDRGGGGGYGSRKRRSRSRSPEGRYAPRRRY
jgi:U1 small nuclear ribonucleoprotein 70kDa